MATEHVTIADPDIHEPKGVGAANNSEVYVANGAGSGTWTDPIFVSSSKVHGEMYITGSTTSTAIASSATYVQIVADWAAGDLTNVTFTTDHLVIVQDGDYQFDVTFSLDRPSGAGNDIYKIDVGVDVGAGYVAGGKGPTRRDISSASVGMGGISSILVGLNAGDKVGLLIQNEADTDDPRITDANLRIILLKADV